MYYLRPACGESYACKYTRIIHPSTRLPPSLSPPPDFRLRSHRRRSFLGVSRSSPPPPPLVRLFQSFLTLSCLCLSLLLLPLERPPVPVTCLLNSFLRPLSDLLSSLPSTTPTHATLPVPAISVRRLVSGRGKKRLFCLAQETMIDVQLESLGLLSSV